jgi:hypothetical protein
MAGLVLVAELESHGYVPKLESSMGATSPSTNDTIVTDTSIQFRLAAIANLDAVSCVLCAVCCGLCAVCCVLCAVCCVLCAVSYIL